MNVEELLRNSLHTEAGTAAPIDNLLDTSISKGQRKLRRRRTAAVVGTVGAMGIVGAGAVIVSNLGPTNSQVVTTPAGSEPTTAEPVTPWWQAWSTDRHDGPVDQTFLDNARPDYGNGPEHIKVWATGTAPDGTDWLMFTSPTTTHQVQWLQGWDGLPNYGERGDTQTPDLSWTSFATPTRAAHDSTGDDIQQWLIIVGQPGTTTIDYSPNGQNWTPLDVTDGIAIYKVPGGFPPAGAKVRLGDAAGVYATGTPAGAGAAARSESSPTATANPLAIQPSPTPTN